ncbi:MAG: ribonuclease P protein component [Candidatus Paceibacterota bacterium]|jgi:ribonuclease P protein component
MLPRSQRLSVPQFNVVMKTGRVTHSSFFILRAYRDNGIEGSRIAAVVPVKVAKTAVLRNRFRRKIYEAIGPLYPALLTNIHGIVFAKSDLLKAKTVDLEKDIRDLFVKGGLLK